MSLPAKKAPIEEQRLVEALERGRLPGPRVPHHDARAIDGRRVAPGEGAHELLRLHLGLFVRVRELLTYVELVLANDAPAIARDERGTDVVEPSQAREALGEVEDVARPLGVVAARDPRAACRSEPEAAQWMDVVDALGEPASLRSDQVHPGAPERDVALDDLDALGVPRGASAGPNMRPMSLSTRSRAPVSRGVERTRSASPARSAGGSRGCAS